MTDFANASNWHTDFVVVSHARGDDVWMGSKMPSSAADRDRGLGSGPTVEDVLAPGAPEWPRWRASEDPGDGNGLDAVMGIQVRDARRTNGGRGSP